MQKFKSLDYPIEKNKYEQFNEHAQPVYTFVFPIALTFLLYSMYIRVSLIHSALVLIASIAWIIPFFTFSRMKKRIITVVFDNGMFVLQTDYDLYLKKKLLYRPISEGNIRVTDNIMTIVYLGQLWELPRSKWPDFDEINFIFTHFEEEEL